MTEPTQAQIEEAKQLRAKFAFRGSLDVYTNELASIIAYIRREATNAALEEAAKKCEQRANSLRDGVAIANLCARDVRSLKDQP